MRSILHIVIGVFIICLISCNGIKTTNKKVYIGNFKEKKYDFLESIRHNNHINYYYSLPFELKFSGIRPYPFDTIGKKEYLWLRNAKNLIIAFNTFKSVGLSNFVSREKYCEANNDWCCDTQWENKSFNEIVKGYIHSDTNTISNDYYSKFWQRRREENNLKETYQILMEIDKYYHIEGSECNTEPIDTILQGLLIYNLKLLHSDSIAYPKTVLYYFNYLKSVDLEYSAYKLIFNNPRINFDKSFSDSLLQTLDYDTLSINAWGELNDNTDGWITGEFYPDPNREYGP
jgi:hypothetical protein